MACECIYSCQTNRFAGDSDIIVFIFSCYIDRHMTRLSDCMSSCECLIPENDCQDTRLPNKSGTLTSVYIGDFNFILSLVYVIVLTLPSHNVLII